MLVNIAAEAAALLQRIPRRILIGVWFAVGLATAVALAPDAARNLVMLAWLRSWTQPNDRSLTGLAPVVRWMRFYERSNSYLQAQTAGMSNSLGDAADGAAALERARTLAPIARQCNSSDAMLLESLAQPLLPRPGAPRRFMFVAHSASRPGVSQMRTVAGSDGGANCLHMLTLAAPTGADEFGAMHAFVPMQPGRRYQIDAECYVTGPIRVDIQAVSSLTSSLPIEMHDAWTTITLRVAADQNPLSYVQVIAREGSGRVTCRNTLVSDITDASR